MAARCLRWMVFRWGAADLLSVLLPPSGLPREGNHARPRSKSRFVMSSPLGSQTDSLGSTMLDRLVNATLLCLQFGIGDFAHLVHELFVWHFGCDMDD